MDKKPPPVPPRPSRDAMKRTSTRTVPASPSTADSGTLSFDNIETDHPLTEVYAPDSTARPRVGDPNLVRQKPVSNTRPHTIHGSLAGQSESDPAVIPSRNPTFSAVGNSIHSTVHPSISTSSVSLSTSLTSSHSETAMSSAVLSPTGIDSDTDAEDDNVSEELRSSTQFSPGNLTNINSSTVKMNKYEARLATFATWPPDHPQDPKTFAKYGMFYTGHGDKTQCYSCGIVIWGWKSYKGLQKAPLIAHKKFYRNCGFLKSRSWADAASKLNLSGTMMDWEKADAPFMLLQQTRLDSFLSDANLLSFLQSSDQAKSLAEAGFYRMAPSPNATDFPVHHPIVKCFYCGLILRPGDCTRDSWVLHAQLAPQCTYVKRKKGPLYVRKIQKKLELDRMIESGSINSGNGTDLEFGSTVNSALPSPSVIKNFVTRNILPKFNQLYKTQSAPSAILVDTSEGIPSLPRAVADERSTAVNVVSRVSIPVPQPEVDTGSTASNRRTTPSVLESAPSAAIDSRTAKLQAVREVLKMGFGTRQVEIALEEFDRIPSNQPLTVERLVQVICDLEERDRLTSTRPDLHTTVDPGGHGEQTSSHTLSTSLAHADVGDLLPFEATSATAEPVQQPTKPHKRSTRRQQHQQTTADRTCIICMEEQSNYAFVPCGHVQTCLKCSVILDTCPLCRQAIQDRIRIYL